MSKDTTEFIVYIIHEIANRLQIYPSAVYRALEKADCIQKYLIPCYDVLHTMSTQCIADNVLEYLRVRGVEL